MGVSEVTLSESIQDLDGIGIRTPAELDHRRGEPQGSVQAYYEDIIKVPGFDKQPQRCMPYSPVGFCRQAGHVVLGRSSCQTRGCPEHWRTWLKRAVIAQTARLAAYRYSQDGWDRRTVHATISPPQEGVWDAARFWDARRDVYDVAEDVGIRGGVLIPHPYRSSDHGDHLFETATAAGDWEEDRGKWALFRDVADGWQEMKRFTEEAPHYHLLAPVRDFNADAVPEGWVAKNIRSMDRFHIHDVESYRAMAKTSWYLLTHAPAQVGRHSVTYFGEVHPASFDPEEELTPAEWRRIQKNAEKAVTTRPGGVPRETGVGAMECPEDDCQSDVVGIERLSEFIDRDEWFASIAPKQRNMLRALEAWIVLQVDRPPPGRRRSLEDVETWLIERGARLTDVDRQPTGAGTAPGLLSQL